MIFWHRPMIPAAKGGMQWHAYTIASGTTLCGVFQLLGQGRPEDARSRMPSRATAKICATCERKRPPTTNSRQADNRSNDA